MKHKWIALLLAVLMVGILPLSAAADTSGPALVVDDAQLFTQQELAQLELTAQQLRDTYQMDIVIVTRYGLDGKTPQDFADDYYDSEGYGYGSDYSGILFLLDMQERSWYISTCGEAIYAVTDYGVQQLGETALPYLAEGAYFDAFCAYFEALSVYLDAYAQEDPIDGYADYSGDYYHGDQDEIVYYEEDVTPSLFLSLICGVVVAGITVLIMRMGMNTKRQQHGAGSYMKPGSYQLNTRRDLFLYSNISKVKRQQPSSTGSSGGGSSVHRSSSGRKHGGGGGKF